MSSSTDSVTCIPSSPSLDSPNQKQITTSFIQAAPMETTTEYVQRHYTPKTSISHPINISWILPNEYLPLLSYCQLPQQMDMFDLTGTTFEMQIQLSQQIEQANYRCQQESVQLMGNLALSSCPGKKVRLTGPVRGRAAINRDLDLDFTRMKSFGITTLVCCLDDEELGYLGAPWETYSTIAIKHGLQVFRLPMVEGSCPDTLEEVDIIVNKVNERIFQGENVLTHCRGGVGRAGLFACCWLIKNMLCHSAERAIRYVRARRSPKAIETMRQAEFVIHYTQFISKKLEQRQQQQQQQYQQQQQQQQNQVQDFNLNNNNNNNNNNSNIQMDDNVIENILYQNEKQTQFSPTNHLLRKPLIMKHTDQTLSVPSVIDIGNLERSMCNNSL